MSSAMWHSNVMERTKAAESADTGSQPFEAPFIFEGYVGRGCLRRTHPQPPNGTAEPLPYFPAILLTSQHYCQPTRENFVVTFKYL